MEITNFLKKLKSAGRKLSLEVYLVYSVYNIIYGNFENIFSKECIQKGSHCRGWNIS